MWDTDKLLPITDFAFGNNCSSQVLNLFQHYRLFTLRKARSPLIPNGGLFLEWIDYRLALLGRTRHEHGNEPSLCPLPIVLKK